jgi:uncharacterized membrane protein
MIIDNFFRFEKSRDVRETKAIEKPFRSVVKSISWRIIGTLDTIVIAWFVTEKVGLALTIGSIELVTKMLLYFLHERAWNIIKWGKK